MSSSYHILFSKEIDDHAWEFTPERVAEMLSSDGKAPSDTSVDSAYWTLEKKAPPSWPAVESERAWHGPVAVFLNNCVDACNCALGRSRGSAGKSHRWYDGLKFIVHDDPVEGEAKGIQTIRPDLVGGRGMDPNKRSSWSPKDPHTNQILVPVEVGRNWTSMVMQSVTHARTLFSASPSRQFALALGFRHVEAELRFLVFHRSGLTASIPLCVRDEQGRRDILRVFLSILSWKSANDAGFLEFYNDTHILLLRDKSDETGVVARVAEVIDDAPCVTGRASRVFLVVGPPCEGEGLESHFSTLSLTARKSRHQEPRAQTKRGDEIRMLFRPAMHQ